MITAIKQIYALARASFLDVVRQPVVLFVTLSGLLLAGLLPLLIMLQIGEPGRMMRDGGLACHMVFGAAAMCIAASGSLYRDVHGGTAALVLTKPVVRGAFFIGRFLGVAAAAWLLSWMFFATTAVSYRASLIPYYPDWRIAAAPLAAIGCALLAAGAANWGLRRAFVSTAMLLLAVLLGIGFASVAALEDKSAFSLVSTAARLAPASALLGAALTVYTALAFSLGARWSPVFALSVCAAVFLAGMVSDYYFGGAAGGGSPLAAALHAVIPNARRFWVADSLARGGVVPWSYVREAALYGAALSAAFLFGGLILFQRSEIH